MGGYDGSIRIKALMNHSPFDRGVRSMMGSVKQLGSTLKKLAGTLGLVFGTAALVKFTKESVAAASQLSDAWLGLQSIIEGQGRSFSRAQSFIERYISDGLVPLENAVTAYKNLAARGYSTEQIEKTMTALKDAAAFGRQASYSLGDAVSTATEGLKNENSILVDNAGVTKNVAKMWEDYAKSIGTTANKLTQAQKIEAEVNGILQETRFQTGDAAKLVNTYSGQIAMLTFNFQQLKVQVGNALMPIVQAVLPGINAIIAALTRLAQVFAQVTALLFGKPNAGNVGQVSVNEEIASSGQDAADATDKLAGATEGAGEAAEETGKKVKGLLAGFDTLNILGGKTADDLDDIKDGLDLDGLNEAVGAETGNLFSGAEVDPGLLASVDRLRDSLEQLKKFADNIWNVFAKSWEKEGGRVLDAFKSAVRSIWELIKSIGRAFSEAWTGGAGLALLNAFYGYLEMILGVVSDIAGAFKTAWDNVGTELIESIFFKLTEILKLLTSIGQAFREAWNDGTGVEICETILEIWTNVNLAIGNVAARLREAWESNANGVRIWQAVLDMVQAVLSAVKRMTEATRIWAEGLDLEPLVSAFRGLLNALEPLTEVITNGLAWAYENVLLPFAGWFLEELSPVAVDLLSAAIETLTSLIEALKPLGVWLWETFLQPLAAWSGEVIIGALKKLADGLKSLGEWISDNQDLIQALIVIIGSLAGAIWTAYTAVSSFAGIFQTLLDVTGAIGSAISFLTSPIGTMALEIGLVIAAVILLIKYWDEVKEAAGAAWDFIQEKWNAAGEWIQANILDPVTQAFSEFVDGLFSMVEGIVNFFVNGVNAIINALNAIQFSVPEWVPLIGGKEFGFHIQEVPPLRLPRLARGAVIPPNQQFAAVLGDQRSGVNVETPLSTMKQAFLEALSESGALRQQSGGGVAELVIDGRTFARLTYPYIQGERGRIGVNLVAGGGF